MIKNSANFQKGSVLPIVVVILLIAGILLTTGLVKVPQVFQPKAGGGVEVKFVGNGVRLEGDRYVSPNANVEVELTSPYGLQQTDPSSNTQPIYQNDFEREISGWRDTPGDQYFIKLSTGQMYLRVHRGAFYTSTTKDIGTNQWSMSFDFLVKGTNPERYIGISFGSRVNSCNSSGGDTLDCYRFFLSSSGKSELLYQRSQGQYGELKDEQQRKKVIENDKWYKARFDRSLNTLNVYLKERDNPNQAWEKYAEVALDSNLAKGNFVGFVVAAGVDNPGFAEGFFDNLKVYKLGDLAEPTTGFYRYAADPDSINNDPDGNNVKWQPYTAHPYKFNLHYPLRFGVNVLYVQFKSANGEKSSVYQSTIELRDSVSIPSPSSSPLATNVPDSNDRPTFTTSSIRKDLSLDKVFVSGSNFGTTAGTVYYSRGGSHEVAITSGISWSDTLLGIPQAINDPSSPTPNRLVGGQYLRICRVNPYFCSEYIVMPNF